MRHYKKGHNLLTGKFLEKKRQIICWLVTLSAKNCGSLSLVYPELLFEVTNKPYRKIEKGALTPKNRNIWEISF